VSNKKDQHKVALFCLVELVRINLRSIQDEAKRWKEIIYPRFQKKKFALQL